MLKNRKLDLGDVANPKKFFRGDYFEIIPGSGESKTQFDVIREHELLLKEPNTLLLTLLMGLLKDNPCFITILLLVKL